MTAITLRRNFASKNTSTTRKLLALAVASMAAAHASAQLEEVVVTAQKRSESLQDVPIAVSAFTNEALKEFGIVDTQSLQMVTPGLIINNTSSSASPYLRGVGTRLSTLGLESSVALYIDDRYVSRTVAALFDLTDVERIEVLKGPQGTLYGRNATGGAMRVITKDPGEELAGEAGLTVGSDGLLNVNGLVGGPISDSMRAQITVASNNRDGYADNIFLDEDSNDREFYAARGKLLWDISDDATMKLAVAHWKRDDSNANQQQAIGTEVENVGLARGGVAGDDREHIASALDGRIEADETSVDLRFDVAFDTIDFASITTFADGSLDGNTDADGTSSASLDVYTYEETETLTQEFQLVSNYDGPWQWLLGAYYFDQEGEASFTADFIFPFGTGILSNELQEVDTKSYALFGQTTYDLSDQWSLTAGARWGKEEKDVKQTHIPGTIGSGVGDVAQGAVFTDDDSWTSFTPMLTLRYTNDFGMVYLSYSEGFKSGGFNYPAANPSAVPLDPEEITQYELGFKGDLLDGVLRLNAALFYYDYTDLQVTRAATSGGSVSLVTENAADATVLGLDLDVTWLATDALTINFGLNALDSEYKDYDASAKVTREELTGSGSGFGDIFYDADGESLLRAPDYSAFVSARYEVEMSKATLPMVITYSYKDSYLFDFIASQSTRALEQDAFGLLSARLSYVPNAAGWSVSVWGNNLTDEEYYNEVVANGFSLRGNWAAPRTYGVDFNYMF